MSALSPLKMAFLKGINLLPARVQESCFWHLAKKFGIREMTVEWKYGEIQGSVSDEGIFREIVHRGFSEPLISLILEADKKNNFKAFLDLGANIGSFSIPLVQNTQMVSYAFEPEPRNFRMLQHNIFRYGFTDRIHAYQIALFDKDAKLQFELSDSHSGDHRLRLMVKEQVADFFSEATRKIISVPAKRLDSLFLPTGPSDSIALPTPYIAKMDIQGAEYHAYLGGRETLKHADLFFVELWPYAMERLGHKNSINLVEMLLDDFPYGGILRPDRPYHDPDLNKPSARLLTSLRALADDTHPAEYCDVVLSRKPIF